MVDSLDGGFFSSLLGSNGLVVRGRTDGHTDVRRDGRCQVHCLPCGFAVAVDNNFLRNIRLPLIVALSSWLASLQFSWPHACQKLLVSDKTCMGMIMIKLSKNPGEISKSFQNPFSEWHACIFDIKLMYIDLCRLLTHRTKGTWLLELFFSTNIAVFN